MYKVPNLIKMSSISLRTQDAKCKRSEAYVFLQGTLDNGETIAVKKLALTSDQAESQFVAEVKFITSVQHRNLIRLHGYCVDSMERILVYEFLPNQSLDKHIFSKEKNSLKLRHSENSMFMLSAFLYSFSRLMKTIFFEFR